MRGVEPQAQEDGSLTFEAEDGTITKGVRNTERDIPEFQRMQREWSGPVRAAPLLAFQSLRAAAMKGGRFML